MTYTARPNGTHAFACDVPQCLGEILAPTEPDLQFDASEEGWAHLPQGHICASCMRGIHTGATAIRRVLSMMGVTGDEVSIAAPGPVQVGDEAVQEYQGQVHKVGTYLDAGNQGDMVRVKLNLPSVQARTLVSPEMQDILNRVKARSAVRVEAAAAEEPTEPAEVDWSQAPALALPDASGMTPEQQLEMNDLFGYLDKGGKGDN